jgi:hypothetical protein
MHQRQLMLSIERADRDESITGRVERLLPDPAEDAFPPLQAEGVLQSKSVGGSKQSAT